MRRAADHRRGADALRAGGFRQPTGAAQELRGEYLLHAGVHGDANALVAFARPIESCLRDRGQRRAGDDRQLRGPGEALHHPDADPQAGETARPPAKGDGVQSGQRQAGLAQQPADGRQQQFGVPHRRLLVDFPALAIEA